MSCGTVFVFGFAWFKIVDPEGEKGGPCVSDDSNLKSCLANNQKLEKKQSKDAHMYQTMV